MSADMSARKMHAIGNHWVAMFSGNDISHTTPMLRHVKHLIQIDRESLPDVVNAFVSAFKEQLRLRADNEILAALGYSLDEFKMSGLVQLGAETFSRILYEIQQTVIDLSFLIAGFDAGVPYIFTVSSPGRVEHYEEVGFWAIGAGQTHALGAMFNLRKRIRFMDLAPALYRVCEAKFSAENAMGVGPTTYAMIMYPDGSRCLLPASGIESLKPLWERTRPSEVAQDVAQKTQSIVDAGDKIRIKPDAIADHA